jgi:hypothetical protein
MQYHKIDLILLTKKEMYLILHIIPVHEIQWETKK